MHSSRMRTARFYGRHLKLSIGVYTRRPLPLDETPHLWMKPAYPMALWDGTTTHHCPIALWDDTPPPPSEQNETDVKFVKSPVFCRRTPVPCD